MYHNLGMDKATDREGAKKDLMSRVDANADGKLDFAEFIRLFDEIYQNSRKALAAISSAVPEDEVNV